MQKGRNWWRSGTLLAGLCLAVLLASPSWAVAGVSGSVFNSSSQSVGRIYLELFNSQGEPMGYGTSLDMAGSYTLQGVPDGTYTLNAFLDVNGSGQPVSTDPVGQSASFDVVGGAALNVNVTLYDNTSGSTVAAPPQVSTTPTANAAMVSWQAPRDQNSFIPADSFNLYWSTSPNPGPTNYTGTLTNIPVSDSIDEVVSGLTNGLTYYFAVTSVLGGTESAPADSPATVIGNPTGGHNVSGSISFTGTVPTPNTQLFVAAFNMQTQQLILGSAFYQSNPQSFTIPGVPDGTYAIYAVADLNADGRIDFGDLKTNDADANLVTVSGADVTNASATLAYENAHVSVLTTNLQQGTNHWYQISANIEGRLKRPVAVTLTGGPNLQTTPVDVGINPYGSGFFLMSQNITGTPIVGDTYNFNVTYADGSTETISGSVAKVLSAFPTNLTPTGNVLNATSPTLNWQAPASPPVYYTYSAQVSSPTSYWSNQDLPASTLSTNYTGSPLALNQTYQYQVQLTDFAGNAAVQITSFTPVSSLASNLPNKIGVFRSGAWYLDANGNFAWDTGTDLVIPSFGQSGDTPVAGDWSGSGSYSVGVFRAGTWYLDTNGNGQWDSGTDTVISSFGESGDIPVVGDWSGGGKSEIGVFRAGKWYLDSNGNGKWDSGVDTVISSFGQAGDIPVVGDWNGDGVTEIGVFRAGKWYLDTNGNGRWDPGVDTVISSFGQSGDIPVVGDWNGDGKADIGVFRAGKWYLDSNGNGQWDSGTDRVVPSFGQSGDIPVVGR